jgi:hypothetical protein
VSRDKTVQLSRADLLEHPAVRAWARLRPESVEPSGIARLQKKRKGHVYLLQGVGPGGSDVIAKCSSRERIRTEQYIYEEVLLDLPLSAVRYYGVVDEGEAGRCWLFLEYADGEAYSPRDEEHRAVAGRWLGLLHASTARAVPVGGLPDRGPGYYLGHLRSARDKILHGLADPGLALGDRAVLGAVAGQCEVVESHWYRVEGLCSGLPRSLIHGDFAPKNMRIRTGPAGAALLPFDWGSAGWGVPAADLVQSGASSDLWSYWASPDLASYRLALGGAWTYHEVRDLQLVTAVGKIFRCLVCIDLDAPDPAIGWGGGSARNMRDYRSEMDEAIRMMGWS